MAIRNKGHQQKFDGVPFPHDHPGYVFYDPLT
jgi:hypothetical protein